MKLRLMSAMLFASLLGAFLLAPFGAQAATKEAKFLKGLAVSGTLADGGTFKGKVSITKFGYDALGGLTVSGVLNGTATKADGTVYKDISQRFSNVEATLSSAGGASALSVQAQASCDILNLDIGAINLDLLGLVVDLSPISLDITAVSGAGNLLGNLLCAVAGLLDPGSGLLTLIENLTQLLNLLNQINQII